MSPEVLSFMAPYGTAVVTKILLNLQSKEVDESPNPVSLVDACSLVQTLREQLPSPVPSWLDSVRHCLSGSSVVKEDHRQGSSGGVLVAIGGMNSMFQCVVNVLDKQQEQHHTFDGIDSASGPSSSMFTRISRKDVQHCINVCTDKSTEELHTLYTNYEDSDGASNMLSKLCLCLAVMEHLDIDSFDTIRSYGCCAGVLNTARFWIDC